MIGRLFKSRATRGRGAVTAHVPPGLRVYCIGDIHGRTDLLDRLHDRLIADIAAAPPADAELVYLGDYVDRGRDSAGVIERLAGPSPAGLRRTLLKGNHEDMMLRFLADPVAAARWRQLGGMETMLSYRVDINAAMALGGIGEVAAEFGRRVPAHHRALLGTLRAWTAIGDYFFCHAGVRPGVPLERQSESDLMWIRDEFLASRADFGKVVVHGHTPVVEPELHANRINIDTGAYMSGRLTCLVLEGDTVRLFATG